MKISKDDIVVFLGDSVTDCGRDRQEEISFGAGYANIINALFRISHPDFLVRFINKGIGGDQTTHVIKRLQTDVLDYRPNIITLCIGINDVLGSYYCPCTKTGVSAEKYRANMEIIIQRILDSKVKLLLMTPYLIDTNPLEPMRITMMEFADICIDLADKYQLEVINLQELFESMMTSGIYSYELSTDRIHPSYMGHMAIAMEIMKRFEA